MERYFEVAPYGTPPATPAASPGYPTNGNPSSAIPASEPGEWWFHMVSEELRAVIVAAGLTPSHSTLTQLRDAIQSIVVGAQQAVIVNGATFEASVANGEVVLWDNTNSRYDEATADGTANNRAVGIADVTNGKVYLYGECALFSGLTPGARYYLSAATPGAITTTAPADPVMVGIAKSATTLFVDIDAGSASILNQVNTWSKGQIGAVTALTDAATIALDLSLSNNFSVTLGGNRTLGNPTNAVAGQSGVIVITQDATGSRTLAYGTNYKAAGGIANLPALSTAANTVDHLYYYVETSTRIVLSMAKAVA